MIRAVIFDFDGTILDTETPIYKAWSRTYEQHGQQLTIEEYSAAIGTDYSVFDPRGTLEQRIGRKLDWATLDTERRNYHLELVVANEILPGVSNLMAEVKARGLRCAVASSSTTDWVESHLQRLGLRQYVDLIVCADPPRRPKPATDVYDHVLAELKIAAAEAVAIEDSPNGATAALRAGIACIGVPNTMTSLFDFPAGIKRVSSLEGMSVDRLFTLGQSGAAVI
ncbi:MAG TPA: HAD-IA family hydrolase [Chthoniobacteraceae bacterium]|nr:HAD-IA family hydrolase [Chthoniobacteraceae bacterium]